MHMMAPVKAGTLTVVCVRKQHPNDAGQCRRQSCDDDQRIEHGLEIDDDQHVDQHDRADQSDQESFERQPHRLYLSLQGEVGTPWEDPS